MRKIWKACSVLCLFFLGVAEAYAASPQFSLVGLGNLTDVSASGETQPTYSSGLGLGGGMLVSFPFRRRRFEFETGLLYVNRKFDTDYSSPIQSGSVNFSAIQVPLDLRMNVSLPLSISLGPYFAQGFGSVHSSVLGNLAFKDAGIHSFDAGYTAGARYLVHQARHFGVFVDARYFASLANVATAPGITFKYTGALVLLGIRLGRGSHFY